MSRFKRPSPVGSTKPRTVALAVASCLAAALVSAPSAFAAVQTSFDPVPFEVPRNTPLTVKLQMTNPDSADVSDVALAVYPSQYLYDTDPPTISHAVTSYDCPGGGTKVTALPAGTPAGTVACHWDAVAKLGGKVAMTVTVQPADGASLSFLGYKSVAGGVSEVDEADAQVARPKADLNVQTSAPAQLAVGETSELKTTLNMVSGESADGVRNKPIFSLPGFSTRNVDVLAVSATAGACTTEPVKTYDPVTGQFTLVIPDMMNISCKGGTLAPGGSITATVSVKGMSPGVINEAPDFSVTGMQDTTPPVHFWEYPQFRVGVYQAPALPAFVDPTPLDQAELAAPAGGLLKVSKKGVAKLTASCHVAAGCPSAVLLYAGGKGKTKITGQATLRALPNGKTTTVTLKLTKKQLKALKAAKKKGIQLAITGAELTITATLVAGK